MQDLIINILFCCLFLLIGVLVIIIQIKTNKSKFDHRILFAIVAFLQGIYVLLSSFELTFFQQKLKYIFTFGFVNAVFLAIALLLWFKKKYLIISSISGIFYLLEMSFVMISSDIGDVSIITFVFIGVSALFLAVTLIYKKIKNEDNLHTHVVLTVIGLLVFVFAFGVRNFNLFDLLKDVKLQENAYFGEILLIFISTLVIFIAIAYSYINRIEGYNLSLKVAITAILTALCVVLSFLNPFAYFELGDFKPNPFVHMINAIGGVFLGPIWGVCIATFVAIIRFSVGIGTIHAFPGGIPGALVVGIVAIMISILLKEKYRIFAALFEPVGTVGLGAIISSILIGTFASLMLWLIFLVSSLIGAALGFWVLWILQKRNININYLSRGDTVIL